VVAGRLLLAVACTLGLAACAVQEPPELLGGPLVASGADGDAVVFLTYRTRRRSIGGTGRTSTPTALLVDHFVDAVALDAAQLAPRWRARLLSRRERIFASRKLEPGWLDFDGMTWVAADRGRVWALADRLVALDVATGAVVADGAAIEAANPELTGRLPSESQYLRGDGGLVITASDGREWRIDAGTLRAEPYAPPPKPEPSGPREHEEAMDAWRIATGGGLVGAGAFRLAGGWFAARWLGLLSAEEADEIRRLGRAPALAGGETVRRTLWSAREGSERGFMGQYQRRILVDPRPVEGSPTFLQGGMLRTRFAAEPIRLEDPEGFLVLHRARLGAAAPLRLARLGLDGRALYDVSLGVADPDRLWLSGDRVLFYGLAPEEVTRGRTQERRRVLISLGTRDGALRGYDPVADQPYLPAGGSR